MDNVGNEIIGGWAWNNAYPNTSINVHVYIRKDGTTYLGRNLIANEYRPDLYAAGYGNGYHGYSLAMDWYDYWPGDYQVTAHGINGSNNPLLYNSPTTFTVQASTGYVEGVTPTSIYGWAWKPSCPNRPVAIHVYIRDMEGNTVTVLGADADDYLSDLWWAGYGNGYHGFTIPIDWNSLPREQLIIEVHPVDNSGFNPIIYNQVYDNRKEMFLLGARGRNRDADGNIIDYTDFASWMTDDIIQKVAAIGTSRVVKWTDFDPNDVIYAMYNSSFCLINTHGSSIGIETEDNGVYGDLEIEDLNGYASDYFSGTKCITLISCCAAAGWDSNQFNFVRALVAKGAQSVVGFEDEIIFYYNPNNEQVYTDSTSGLWCVKYIDYLKEGQTVQQAADNATNYMYANNSQNIPQGYYGFNSVRVGGNPNTIVKH